MDQKKVKRTCSVAYFNGRVFARPDNQAAINEAVGLGYLVQSGGVMRYVLTDLGREYVRSEQE